ncbi:MAG: OmpA family protein [Lachnospiraceae bacterium]|nr:OmpA family protein [Lachnospiraceae bacterium]
MTGKRRRKRRLDEETTYWLSYSDMMAGLLLTFVVIIAFTMLRAQIQYDEKERQLLGKEEELMVQTDALEMERETVATQSLLLDQQKEAIALQETQLLAQAEKLIAQQDQLATQEEELKAQHVLLSELESLMASQQAKLDRIIGVRSELIEALKKEFDDSGLELAVDEQTGAITFQSSILFSYGQSELKATGKEFLDKFLPRYVKILMGPEYREYVSEIIIEGHTDTSGGYLYNLELSQKRAYSVAAYCLADNSRILSKDELEALRAVTTSSGRSYSNPVIKENGEIDSEASRRVEILFRLKDEEMIREMIEILNGTSDEQTQENDNDTSKLKQVER